MKAKDWLDYGENNNITVEQYLALSLIPFAIDKPLNELKPYFDISLNILKNQSVINENAVMGQLAFIMDQINFIHPKITNPRPLKIYSLDTEKPREDVLKSLTLSLYYVHYKHEKYTRDSTIIRKVKQSLENFNTLFKIPLHTDDLIYLANGPVFGKGNDKFDFIEVNRNIMEKKRIKNIREEFLQYGQDLRNMIAHSVFSQIDNPSVYLARVLTYGNIFSSQLIETMPDDTMKKINASKDNPYLEFQNNLKSILISTAKLDPLEHTIVDFKKADLTSTYSQELHVPQFFADLSFGLSLSHKLRNKKLLGSDLIIELKKYNEILKKFKLPNANDGDIEFAVNLLGLRLKKEAELALLERVKNKNNNNIK